MEAKAIPVEVVFTNSYLESLFPLGAKVEIIPILYDRDTEIYPKITRRTKEGLIVTASEAVIAPKGSYKSCYIRSVTGSLHDSNILGYMPLEKFFKKLPHGKN